MCAKEVEFKSPWGDKLLEVLFQRRYPGYLYRRELIDDSEWGGEGKLPMVNCYCLKTGICIGDAKTARILCVKRGLRDFEGLRRDSRQAQIAYHYGEEKWYGWSHRAIFGFGIGDMVFKQRFGNDNTKFNKHGDVKITKLSQAKTAAKRFVSYVS